MEWTSVNLFSKLSLTCGGNVNYYKNVHHPILTLPDGIGNTQAVFKTNQYAPPFSQVSKYVFFSAKVKEKGRLFFGGCKKEGHIVRLPARALGCHKR